MAALGKYDCLGALIAAFRDIKAHYLQMLVALHGDLRIFDCFKPQNPRQERVDQLQAELDQILYEAVNRGTNIAEKAKERRFTWRGGTG